MDYSFKQFLTELMVDIDPAQSPSDMFSSVRKTQMMAQRSPERVIRQQTQTAKTQQNDALRGTSPTKNLEVQIARKKQELYRLEQQLARAQQTQQAATPATGTPQ